MEVTQCYGCDETVDNATEDGSNEPGAGGSDEPGAGGSDHIDGLTKEHSCNVECLRCRD